MNHPRLWLAAFCITTGCAIAACSVILSTDSVQCRNDGDCASHGLSGSTCVSNVCVTADTGVADTGGDVPVDTGPVDPKWGCIGNVKWGELDPAKTVKYRTRFVDMLSSKPIPGIVAKDCPVLDVACTKSTYTGTTDDAGYLVMPLPKFFNGYLELTAPSTVPMVPSLVNLLPPQGEDMDLDADIPLATSPHMLMTSDLDIMLAMIGTKPNPAYGHILGIATDCTGKPVAGVTIMVGTKTAETVAYYTDSTGTPSLTNSETSIRGECGFINLPPGPATVTATANAVSKKMGTFTVLLRPGFVSYLPMMPTP